MESRADLNILLIRFALVLGPFRDKLVLVYCFRGGVVVDDDDVGLSIFFAVIFETLDESDFLYSRTSSTDGE